jgi:hypothetical protein
MGEVAVVYLIITNRAQGYYIFYYGVYSDILTPSGVTRNVICVP